MPQFPPLEPGVTVVGATLIVTLSDGSTRSVEIPSEYGPDQVQVNLVQVSSRPATHGPRRADLRHQVQITVAADFAASRGDERPRSFYRLG
jgi:hypothetical protein